MNTILRLHRWPAMVLGFAAVLSVGLAFSHSVDIPGADAPRFARQMGLALAPCLLSVTALPVVGELEPTLRRGVAVARVNCAAPIIACLLVAAVLWLREGVAGAALEYEAFVVLLISSIGVILARRYGRQGPLVTSALGLVVCLYWNGLASITGFGGFTFTGDPVIAASTWGHECLATSIAITLYVVVVLPRSVHSLTGQE